MWNSTFDEILRTLILAGLPVQVLGLLEKRYTREFDKSKKMNIMFCFLFETDYTPFSLLKRFFNNGYNSSMPYYFFPLDLLFPGNG